MNRMQIVVGVVLIAVSVCIGRESYGEESLKSLVQKCQGLVREDAFAAAWSALDKSGVEQLVEREAAAKRFFFVKVETMAKLPTELLCVPPNLVARVKTEVLPGARCSHAPIEESLWEEAAIHFAFRYNLLMMHQYRASHGIKPEVTLSVAREAVRIDEITWKRLSLESRLRIQFLVTETGREKD